MEEMVVVVGQKVGVELFGVARVVARVVVVVFFVVRATWVTVFTATCDREKTECFRVNSKIF